MSAARAAIDLDIFSDPICPWCYIGLKRLDAALEELNQPLNVTWRCFMLNPDMPAQGMDRHEYLTRKFGGEEGAARVYNAIETAAHNAGLPVDFAKIRRTPSTIKAHQALRAAHDYAGADAFVRALFTAYFEDGEDIGETDVLRRLWEGTGLNGADLQAVFDTDAHLQTLTAEQSEARTRGISGVPFFIAGNKYALSGAQDKSVFQRVFDLLNQEQAEAA